MQRLPQIHLIPSHPCEGWISMNRCWEETLRCAPLAAGRFDVRSVLPFPGLCAPRASLGKRILWKQFLYPLIVRCKVRSGIAHVLDHSYANLLGAMPRGVTKVVTLHDLIPLREPEDLTISEVDRFRQKMEFLKLADLVIADSECTRQDAIELMGLDAGRVVTIPLGVEVASVVSEMDQLPNPVASSPFILSVGSTLKRKRLDLLAPILAEARKDLPDLRLVRVGGKLPAALANEIRHAAGESALEEMGIVDDAVLDQLYRQAHALVMTSRYEGFGLPLLEAMGRGCPVVTTNCTSLPEVGGASALYFDVDRPSDAAQQVVRLAREPGLKSEMSRLGLERAREFSWERYFQKLMEAYDQLLA